MTSVSVEEKGQYTGSFYAYFEKGRTVSLEVDDEGSATIAGGLTLSAKTNTPNSPAGSYVPGRDSGTYNGSTGMKKVSYRLINYGGTGYLDISGFTPGTSVTLSPQSQRFPNGGGIVSFVATGDNVKSVAVSQISGTCDLQVNGASITCWPNQTDDELASNAVVSVFIDDGNGLCETVDFNVSLYQDPGNVSEDEPGVFDVSPTSLNFTADGGDLIERRSTVTVSSESKGFDCGLSSSDQSWIHCYGHPILLMYPPQHTALGFSVWCDENTTGASRSGTITFTGVSPDKIKGLTARVSVYQSSVYQENSSTNDNGDTVVDETDENGNSNQIIINGGNESIEENGLIRRGYVTFIDSNKSKVQVLINQINSSTSVSQPVSETTGTVERSGHIDFINSVGGKIRININQMSQTS